MRKKIALCITRLVQTHLAKNLIYIHTLDRLEDDEDSMRPLSFKTSENLKEQINSIVTNPGLDNPSIVNNIVEVVNDILIRRGDTIWDIKNDNSFKNDIFKVITTNDRIMTCENCRMLMGECDIIDQGGMHI